MSYFEQKNKIKQAILKANNKELQPYEESFLTASSSLLEDAKEKGIEFLYSDLIENDIKYTFRSSLGNGQYISANREASECLEISIRARDVFPKKIPDWVEHSQKCFDHLIIKFISDGLNEKVRKKKGKEYETDIYIHLENKEEDTLKTIGSRLHSIYQYRSKFKHVHYTDENGFRRIRSLRNKDLINAKLVIMDFYKESLSLFLPIYKKYFH